MSQPRTKTRTACSKVIDTQTAMFKEQHLHTDLMYTAALEVFKLFLLFTFSVSYENQKQRAVHQTVACFA